MPTSPTAASHAAAGWGWGGCRGPRTFCETAMVAASLCTRKCGRTCGTRRKQRHCVWRSEGLGLSPAVPFSPGHGQYPAQGLWAGVPRGARQPSPGLGLAVGGVPGHTSPQAVQGGDAEGTSTSIARPSEPNFRVGRTDDGMEPLQLMLVSNRIPSHSGGWHGQNRAF